VDAEDYQKCCHLRGICTTTTTRSTELPPLSGAAAEAWVPPATVPTTTTGGAQPPATMPPPPTATSQAAQLLASFKERLGRQYGNLHIAFNTLDVDRDQRLGLEELEVGDGSSVGQQGGAGRSVGEQVFRSMDVNHNSLVEPVEFYGTLSGV